MTRIIHKQAVQAHAVPKTAKAATGPFPAYEPEISDIDYDPDWFPPGATTQNGMSPNRYQCNACKEILWESELDDHECG